MNQATSEHSKASGYLACGLIAIFASLFSPGSIHAQADDNRHINARDYGAVGDGIADDTAAINAAINAARTPPRLVYLPAGTYKITSTLCFNRTALGYAVGLVGEGADTSVSSASSIPMITIDTAAAPNACGSGAIGGIMGNLLFSGFNLINEHAGTSDIGIRLADAATAPSPCATVGSSCHYLTNNTFKDINFYGTSYGIRNERYSDEARAFFDWNLFTDLKFGNWGNKYVDYAIKFDHGGGGTGNVFSDMTMIACRTACIAMGDRSGGRRVEGLGDILFSSLHMSGQYPAYASAGIELTGGDDYGHRISIVNSQMDAGIRRALDFFDIHAFTVVGTLFGGDTYNNFEACSDYLVDGAGMPDIVPADPVPANPTIQTPMKAKIQSEAPGTQPNLVLAGGVVDRTPRIRFGGPWSVSNPRESYAQILAQNDHGGGGGAPGIGSLRFYTAYGDPAVLSEKVIVTGQGNVGIGTSNPAYKLHVNGSAAATSWTTLSSREFKQDISLVDVHQYPSMLDALNRVGLHTYRYRDEIETSGERRLGMLAEELPREVLTSDGRGVDLYSLLTFAIGALKAQQGAIEEERSTRSALIADVSRQAAEIQLLRAEIATLKVPIGAERD